MEIHCFVTKTEENKPQSVGQFISSFFKKSKGTTQEDAPEAAENISQESLPTWALDSSSEASYSGKEFTTVYPVDVTEGRSLPNVLKRISNLVALKSSHLQDYGDTDLKQYWMPDSVSKECYECSEKFTTFRRRHHCRVCGQIFCSQCCNQQIPGKIFGCTGDLRVCNYCCKVVLSYLQSSDFNADLSTDLKSLQENLESKFKVSSGSLQEDSDSQSLNANQSDGSLAKRKISVGYQEERFAVGSSSVTYLTTEEKCKALQNSVSLRNLFEEICKPTVGLQFETHRVRLKTYTDCVLGSDIVDWLIFQQKAKNRVQASAICQALLEGGYIESLSEPQAFIDGNVFYKKGVVLSPEIPKLSAFDLPYQEEPSWVQQIPQESSTTDSDNEQMSPINISQGKLTSSSSYTLDLNLEASTVYLSRPSDFVLKSPDSAEVKHKEQEVATIIRPSEMLEAAPASGWFVAANLREEHDEKLSYDLLTEAYEQHEQSLLKQLICSRGLSLSWFDVIRPVIHDVVAVIRPDANHDAVDLDIRNYVKFKKLSGGSRTDTMMIKGIVCSKNVAHKRMATDIENPKILLLQCSIVYQRTEGRLMSLEPVLMQEHEYLRHVSARIVALRPDVVLVQRNVSRLAQDFLREHQVVLVHNVKRSVLERLARCSNADLVTAVDAHIGRPKLGTCRRFQVKSFNIDRGGMKTLMYFEGLPSSHLGATVLLRGGSMAELAQVKQVCSLLLFAAYNWRLEKSFLMDEFAMPPNPRCEFLDDSSKENSPGFMDPKRGEFPPDEEKKEERIPIRRSQKEDKMEQNEGKKIIVEKVEDFTDPLHSYKTDEEPTSGKKSSVDLKVAELPLANHFRKALNDSILCLSPYIVFPVPYFELDAGKKCKLREFFPKDIYFYEQYGLSKKNKWKEAENFKESEENKKNLKPLHPFLTTNITNVDNVQTQNLLAHFRACGGRYEKRENICKQEKKAEERPDGVAESKDALDPKNHQRLAVLFCSFSYESNNSPAFCVNPWVVYMDFYGRNDIPLGCFLERYCFRPTYYCPSKNCDTPMEKHIRRFVHNTGCVSVYLNHFDSEFRSEENIVTWTWCTKCQRVSPVASLSDDSWSYSFAKYLELKYYGDMFGRRGPAACSHSLHHDHYQYFGYKNYVAWFKYSTINIWDISLPPILILIQYNTSKLHNQLIDEIRVMSQKGHEIFAFIHDKLVGLSEESDSNTVLRQTLTNEQIQFKQKVEKVQIKLTSPTIENKEFDEKEVHAAYCNVFDDLIRIKRSIVETIETWNCRLNDITNKKKDSDRKKEKNTSAEIEKSVEDIQESQESSNIQIEKESPNPLSKKIKSLDSDSDSVPPSPKSHQRSQSDGTVISQAEESTDNKKEDKKYKNILSHLLPSSANSTLIPSPFNCQEHYILPESSIPIVVYENEPSSIVSYTLSSTEYKKSFEELVAKKNQNNDQSPSPLTKRKGQSDKDKNEDDKSLSILGFLRKEKDIKTELNNHTGNNSETVTEQPTTTTDKSEHPKKNRNAHIEVQFEDSNCNFFCRVYMAEKFAALRSNFLPIGEEEYIRSLSRSAQWNARGGKSGSNFAKTADDRFILKDMSKNEVHLFLENAANYFVYMNKCFTTRQPTLLGKIVGIYQIVFRNNNNVPHRSNLLVMENLFYNRTVKQKFDLKGSVRNRLVIPDNQEGEIVLLDENLLKLTCDSPLYILPHSKSVLMSAIQNDTEFLATQSVMDYSLLVGLDEENKELVLGIIDYIRTFTWDKRLETIVKKSGLLGGQGKLPTIISPDDYQKRFIEAMHRYFLEVPDHWAGLGKGLDL
nr:unnamed protein product [Callosobruchus analis]